MTDTITLTAQDLTETGLNWNRLTVQFGGVWTGYVVGFDGGKIWVRGNEGFIKVVDSITVLKSDLLKFGLGAADKHCPLKPIVPSQALPIAGASIARIYAIAGMFVMWEQYGESWEFKSELLATHLNTDTYHMVDGQFNLEK